MDANTTQLLLDYSERMRKEMERDRAKHDASLAALEAGLAQAAESLVRPSSFVVVLHFFVVQIVCLGTVYGDRFPLLMLSEVQ